MVCLLTGSMLAMVVGLIMLGYLGRRFSSIFSRVKESGAVEIPGPHDNFSCVEAIAGRTRVVYSSLIGARYVSREKTIYLSFPQGSRNLWALLEAVHEAGHAAYPHPLVEILAASQIKKIFSLVIPVAFSFLAGWRVQNIHFSASLLVLLVAVPVLTVAAISYDEVRVSGFSRRWLSSYLKDCGFEKHIVAVDKMVCTEKIFMVLDGFALFLLFTGASVSLWVLGRFL